MRSNATEPADSGASSASEGRQTATAADRRPRTATGQEASRSEKVDPVHSKSGEARLEVCGQAPTAYQRNSASGATADRATAAATEDQQENRDSGKDYPADQNDTTDQSPAGKIHTDHPASFEIDCSDQAAITANATTGCPTSENTFFVKIDAGRSADRAAGQGDPG